ELGEDGEAAARAGVDIARRRNVLTYIGPWSIGALVRTTKDAAERERLLAEGESLIAAGTLRHCELAFYGHVLAGAMDRGDREQARTYLARLEQAATESDCWFQLRNVAAAKSKLGIG